MNRRACLIAFLSAHAASAAAHAQLIAVKSAPIADGGQFAFLPSANLGMGGLSIALADSSLDPFTNPAKGSRLTGARVFGAPTFFSVSRKAGGGLTLPLGMSASSGKWFSQVLVAIQEVDNARTSQNSFPELAATLDGNMQVVDQTEISRTNRFLHGSLGRRFGGQLSVAASASWWRLNALDGIELFYGGSNAVRQSGDALDMRLGVFKEVGRQSFEAVVLHNRLGMDEDVAFIDQFWDPSNRTFVVRPRLDPNADRTRTSGLHFGYTRVLSDTTWRVGAVVTGNHISQPSIPGFELPQVPADAGRSNAFNLGGGIARHTGPWTVGFDAIYEPIWSKTWVNADRATETTTGQPIEVGENTLNSRFRYSNAIARLGFAVAMPMGKDKSLKLETGGQVRAIRYHLDQWDAVRLEQSESRQNWNEWTRTWGASVRLVGADLRYRGKLTTGAGRPGFDDFNGVIAIDAALSSRPVPGFSSFAPFGLVFDDVRAFTHQISLSVPIR